MQKFMKKYPIGSVAIGVLQVADAFVLFLNGGAATNTTLTFASFEFLWALISLVVLIRVKQRATRVLASVFFAYNASGWLLAFFLGAGSESFTVPVWAVVFGGVFGCMYAASALYVARQPAIAVYSRVRAPLSSQLER